METLEYTYCDTTLKKIDITVSRAAPFITLQFYKYEAIFYQAAAKRGGIISSFLLFTTLKSDQTAPFKTKPKFTIS